jgi:hypothetical protein
LIRMLPSGSQPTHSRSRRSRPRAVAASTLARLVVEGIGKLASDRSRTARAIVTNAGRELTVIHSCVIMAAINLIPTSQGATQFRSNDSVHSAAWRLGYAARVLVPVVQPQTCTAVFAEPSSSPHSDDRRSGHGLLGPLQRPRVGPASIVHQSQALTATRSINGRANRLCTTFVAITMQTRRSGRPALGIMAGLTDDDLRRPVLPSGWTCLGMINHLAVDVELFSFRAVVAGRPCRHRKCDLMV